MPVYLISYDKAVINILDMLLMAV